MNKVLYKLKGFVPISVRKRILGIFNFEEYREYSNRMSNPFKDEPDSVAYNDSALKVGIVYSKMHYHKFWIAACRELEVSYQIIYLENSNWMEQVQNSKCDLFVVWPDISSQDTKTMQDERLRIMEEELNLKVYPSLKEIWLYENKRVQHYWLQANDFPSAKTWVFYDLNDTIHFLKFSKYPLVFKSNLGASASGVYIIKDKAEAIKKATEFLKKGYKMKGSKAAIRQKGSLYIQEFLPNAKEWRMVRIGDSYFGHGKDMTGQFHSGSGKANWDIPPLKAFELLHKITEKGKFQSMDVDLFEDTEGNFFVNELQTVFGNSIAVEQLKKESVPGRLVRGPQGEFHFEAGDFCRNHLCNLRLKTILKSLRYK